MFMKTNCMTLFFGMLVVIGLFSQPNAQASITEKLSRIDLTSATLSDIIDVLGEPKYYYWDGKTRTKTKLPAAFIISYSNAFHIFITGNKIGELRFEGPGTDYAFEGKLRVGSRLDTALGVVGQPDAIVRNSAINFNRSGVLYTKI